MYAVGLVENYILMFSSGNRTPGSRSYSDLLDTSVCIPQLVLNRHSCHSKCWAYSYNCRRLTYGSFQLTHISRDSHAVELIELWWPKPRQNIITVLAKLPQGWVSARKHQCSTAITKMWTESSWAFPEGYTADDSWIVRSSNGNQRKTKVLITPPPRWVSAIIIRLSQCTTAITMV